MSIYLDYNASAPIDDRVLEKMIYVYKNVIGNADSRTHDFGDNARKIVEDARGKVASILGINKDEVFFTSGATESNNIVIQGLEEYGRSEKKMHIITTAIEHKAVLETAKAMQKRGFEVDFIMPGSDGRVSAEEVLSKVREDTLLVSVMHVNNETGVIQPVKEIGEALAGTGTFFHIDATQSFGKLVDELKALKYDMMSMSAHKLGGPQGVGGLILRKKHYKLPPVKNVMYGGQQEKGLRPGTIPVALIAGLGEACEIAEKDYKVNEKHNREIKDAVFNLFSLSGLKYEYNGDQEYGISSAVNVFIEGVASEALMLATKQYCSISNGSACNSNSYSVSYVLKAMGLEDEVIRNSIRISWGHETDREVLVEELSKMIDVAKTLV
jgi:cysteine desulfurase